MKKIIKVLYLYDHKDWAIHNVGKLWLTDIKNIETTFSNNLKFNKDDFRKYDFIWFGHLDIFLDIYSKFYMRKENLNKCIVAIHDPIELFPQTKNWKQIKLNLSKWWLFTSWSRWAKLRALKRTKHIIVISIEMQSILRKYKINSTLIPTSSNLPDRDQAQIKTIKCSVLSVFVAYPRKNVALMETLQNYCLNVLNIKFDTKIGKKILSTGDYINLLDMHEIYICTSYQEGGPLPAMDAMRRGLVVISSPVGQIQEIVQDGVSGFICKSENEFLDKITFLLTNPSILHTMRIESIKRINQKRNTKVIKMKSATFLSDCSISETPSNTTFSINIDFFLWTLRNIIYRIFRIIYNILYDKPR
jgi:hypothetical protein